MAGIEAVGFAIAVAGLVPLCAQGFDFIQGMVKARDGLEERSLEITMQSGAMVQWAIIWGVSVSGDEAARPERLERYFENNKAMRSYVLLALAHISDKFANTTELVSSYGLHSTLKETELSGFKPGDVLAHKEPGQLKELLKKRRKRMDLITRFYRSARFKLKDEKKFDGLIRSIDNSIDKLYKMCSELQAQQIQRSILSTATAVIDPTEARTLARAAANIAERRRAEDKKAGGFEWLSEVLSFKARLQQEPIAKPNPLDKDKEEWLYKIDGWKFGELSQYSLIKNNKTHRFSYIEWRSYSDKQQDLHAGLNTLDNIMELAKFAMVEGRPRSLTIFTCLGVLEDATQRRCGLVYELPDYIAKYERAALKQEAPSDGSSVSSSRKPSFLSEMIKTEPILDLGDRFVIAKKLAQSLFVLHSSSWVHKRLRASAITFLPAKSADGPYPSTRRKDVLNPILWDFSASRPHWSKDRDKWKTSAPDAVVRADIYQHPAKRERPGIRYTQAFDVYSLGCVLLELGFWQTLDQFKSDDAASPEDPKQLQARLIKLSGAELRGQMGRMYADAVWECLNLSGRTTDQEVQYVLCWKVASALDRCVA